MMSVPLLAVLMLGLQVSSTLAKVNCVSNLIYMANGPGKNCIRSCKRTAIPNPLFCPASVEGCYCPPEKPFETCTLNGLPKCVEFLTQCICPGGQKYQKCACTKTCDNQSPDCGNCMPGCACPDEKPIWHNGKCINAKQCICPDKCVTQGCDECNKCKCKSGKLRGCTKKGCPDLSTKEGFGSLLKAGCWRLCPSGKRCIFYSHCPDNFNPSCKTFPGGYCKECNKCECNKDGTETCTVNIQSCADALEQSVRLGCYRLIKGSCTYVNPCPEHPSEQNCCQCSTAGQMSCKGCHECECVNGLKICNKGVCPDPTQPAGCYVSRSYPGFPKTCFYVSPCPVKQLPGVSICTLNPSGEYCNTCALCKCGQPCIQPRCADPKLNSCYLYSEKLGRCEFVSPCPQCCCDGEMTCRDCNECVCKDGQTECTNKKCGNPREKGCWVYNQKAETCEFSLPCPEEAVLDPVKFCSNNLGARFCNANDCNVCTCSTSSPGPIACTRRACFLQGCWRPQDGYCKFMLPCPN